MEELIRSDIEAYAEAHSIPESDLCRRLREETEATRPYPQMVVGPHEAAFLKVLVRMIGAEKILEIGMFTGYSALSMAEVLPPSGRIITCEVDQEAAAVARRYFAMSPHGEKIDIRIGPALKTLSALRGSFDLIFIDADKENYPAYYERAMELMSPRGVIAVDNVLWSGDVLNPHPDRASTRAIQKLNRRVASDPRVEAVLVPIRDGILLVRPRGDATA